MVRFLAWTNFYHNVGQLRLAVLLSNNRFMANVGFKYIKGNFIFSRESAIAFFDCANDDVVMSFLWLLTQFRYIDSKTQKHGVLGHRPFFPRGFSAAKVPCEYLQV